MSYPEQGMTLDGYQEAAARTGGRDLAGTPEAIRKGLSCAGLGLCGEAGEAADIIKKFLHHGVPLDEEGLHKELGDTLWYLAHACNVLGWSLESIAESNLAKLRKRYPDGFNTADSVRRRDVK